MNQKNHFVSTYQKDYVWPDMPGICQTEPSTKPPISVKVCACTDSPQVLKELLDTSLGGYLDRDRTRQLSETKICKTRLAKKLDRPSKICVKKLKKEYPDELLEEISPDVDRFKTTYQAHYSDPAKSFFVCVVIALLNAILYYALYRATITSIVLVKGCIIWLFQGMSKFNLSQGATNTLPMDLSLSCPA
ncbi:hypothetical protein EAG_10427 [Camponotus floridanus]|uniref:Uncharacterized protein n=1 Tax=Camponotus floridanus TaxID=104421 RepID=E2ADU2_CAMFO|nr:hypothetical protein EAG_10427 [Camponotus floridanus]